MSATAAVGDPMITTFGRLVEVYGRLERTLGQALEVEFDLPHSWFEVLVRLARCDGGQLTMGDLADQVVLTTGGVTRMIDRMAAAGYVERRPCQTDRRVTYAGITEAGREKLEQAASAHAAHLRSVFGGFSDRDLATFNRLLDRLRDSHPAV